MCNIHGNRVNQDLLVRSGSGYVGKHGRDLLMANDRWFRGINLKYGPDGSVYLIDWYDQNACHRTNPLIWDRTNGRIYKITYGEPSKVIQGLEDLSDEELIGLHTHENEWYVRTARKILQSRRAKVAESLKQAMATADTESQLLRYIWTLHVTTGIDDDLAAKLLSHKYDFVRAWTIQLILEDEEISGDLLRRLIELAKNDSSSVVRLYIASALQRLRPSQRWNIVNELVLHGEDTEDHNLPLMYWYGIEPLIEDNPQRALKLVFESKIPKVTQFILRRAAASEDTLGYVLELINDSENPDQWNLVLDEVIRAFEGRVGIKAPNSWKNAYEKLSRTDHADIQMKVEKLAVLFGDIRIFPKLRETLQDTESSIADRKKRT